MARPGPTPAEYRRRLLAYAVIGAAALAAAVVMAQAVRRSPGEAEGEDLSPGGAAGERPQGQAVEPPAEPQPPAHLRVVVHERYPHQRDAFTQGLLWHDGRLLESTGLHGQSSLREVDLRTGDVLRVREVDPELFAEGLALVEDRLIQLTWEAGQALVWGLDDFALQRRYTYRGEGWGLCFDGESLVMSDGSSFLTFRDPETFAVRRRGEVLEEGLPVRNLNELECVDGAVWANVWMQDWIVRIDPGSGRVRAVVDAGGLLSAEERFRTDVLNGIAYVPERERFLLTGKRWPWVFEVTFEPTGRD
ncbi:MAG: glutaminyl-peptide cyclotransferase [Sandaracinaceae bacterium]